MIITRKYLRTFLSRIFVSFFSFRKTPVFSPVEASWKITLKIGFPCATLASFNARLSIVFRVCENSNKNRRRDEVPSFDIQNFIPQTRGRRTKCSTSEEDIPFRANCPRSQSSLSRSATLVARRRPLPGSGKCANYAVIMRNSPLIITRPPRQSYDCSPQILRCSLRARRIKPRLDCLQIG